MAPVGGGMARIIRVMTRVTDSPASRRNLSGPGQEGGSPVMTFV
jgi:hypothetical protein